MSLSNAKQLMLGNKAVARGLYEAGVCFISSYPGTPSTEVTEEAAKVFAGEHIKLFGNESQTVGPEDAPKSVHLTMLSQEIVLLEGIRLKGVPEGVYLLNAAPLNLGGADGAPCRAVLMSIGENDS